MPTTFSEGNVPMFPMGSTSTLNSVTSSTAFTPEQEQRRKQRFNSQIIDDVLSGKTVDEITETFEGHDYVWNAICCPTRTSLLHIAATLGKMDVIKKIFENGGNMTHRDHADRTALHLAAWNGHAECLTVLLDTDSRENINSKTVEERGPEDREAFPMDFADSFYHNHEAVRALVAKLPAGSTPLHAASIRGQPECMQVLVNAGASIELRDDRGLLPFDVLGENVQFETEYFEDNSSVQNVTSHPQRIRPEVRPRSTPFSFTGVGPEFSAKPPELSLVPVEPEPESDIVRPTSFAELAERLKAGSNIFRLCGANQGNFGSNNQALHTAVAMNLEMLVDYHLSRGADPFSINLDGETVIFVAMKKFHWKMMEKLLGMFRELANTPNRSGDLPIHAATHLNANQAIDLLLEYGANPLMVTSSRSSVLHVACTYGRTVVLRELLRGSKDEPINQLLEAPDMLGRTPLHCAVEGSSEEAWAILRRAGASVEACTREGRSVLHTAIYCENNDMLPVVLRENTNSVNKILEKRDILGYTPLLFAVCQGNENALEILLDAGANPDALVNVDEIGEDCTALHLAASKGFEEIVNLLLERRPELLHRRNGLGWPSIYVAAYFGKSEAVEVLLSHGADLASTVLSKEGKRKSTINEFVENIRQPGALLQRVLDSKITINDYLVSHPECEVNVQYDVLIPEVDDQLQSGRQMRVVDAVLNCGEKNCKQLISHPLVRTFLQKRWTAISPCYWFLVFLHVMMVTAHTGLIIGAVWGNLDSPQLLLSRVTLVAVSLAIATEEIIHASQMVRLYISDSQTWLKWASLILAVFVASENPEYIHATTHPKTFQSLSSSTESPLALIARERSWVRHVVALSALTTWIELLLILSRSPTLGMRVQMFYKVAVSVIKVLMTFSILLIGFSFAFMVQFGGEPPFETILGALGHTLVMMTSEFNYSDMFTIDDGILSRTIFFLFLLFVAIVLMNLLVGLAVSDITYLEDQGRRRCLEQQAAFLIVLENITYSTPIQKLLPQKCLSSLSRHISVTPKMVLYPGRPRSRRMARLMEIPEDLQEDLIGIATR